MSDHTPAGDDSLTPFQLDRLNVRGRVARLDQTIDAILRQHAYPDSVSGLVAEATLLTALIGASLKLKGRLSLQIRGKGAVRLIATDFFAPQTAGAPAEMRAYASFDPEAIGAGADMASLMGDGVFGLLLDHGEGGQPYQGLTPLVPEGLARCAEIYFAQSEQLSTAFGLSVARASVPGGAEAWRAGGVMIQHLPPASQSGGQSGVQPETQQAQGADPQPLTASAVAEMSDSADDWTAAAAKLATVESHELLGPMITPEQLLVRLYHEDSPRAYPPAPVRFGCTCSVDRVETALAQYSRKDLSTMENPDGSISADCQFCGAQYSFDPEARTAARIK